MKVSVAHDLIILILILSILFCVAFKENLYYDSSSDGEVNSSSVATSSSTKDTKRYFLSPNHVIVSFVWSLVVCRIRQIFHHPDPADFSMFGSPRFRTRHILGMPVPMNHALYTSSQFVLSEVCSLLTSSWLIVSTC